MRYAFYDNPNYRYKQSIITKKYYKLHPKVRILIKRICHNSLCKISFQVKKPSDPKIYCSHSCAASINNRIRKRVKKIRLCLDCNNTLNRSCLKYCSTICQNNLRYKEFIFKWKSGFENGTRGITTKIISSHVRRYLLEKYREQCSRCGWNTKHPKTLVVPLEVNHIDGNSENNKEKNLELLCPNCHALTPNFRNLNKGKGRSWRIRYLTTLI